MCCVDILTHLDDVFFYACRQRDYQEKIQLSEQKLNEYSARIRHIESDDKNSSLRKEYMNLEKTILSKKKDLVILEEELQIANLEPKEAHQRFIARVNDFKAVCCLVVHVSVCIYRLLYVYALQCTPTA